MPDQTARLATALQERYLIEGELGQGGMASVYLAHDVRHNRKVALKVLRPDVVEQLGAQRFLHEIRIAATLSHPHILPVFDSGERDGVLYYVMPYVQGDSLRARLDREGPLALREAVRILRDVADALAYAHAHGVVHRDVKPDNVMLTGRHALVADFGVARALSYTTGSHQVTTAGVALGTPTYMAPEQAVADPNIDHRVDIYAFGSSPTRSSPVGRPSSAPRSRWDGRARYASRTRGMRLRHAHDAAEAPVAIIDPVDWSLRAARFRWAELLRRIVEVDPLACPRCRVLMRIVAVITDPAVLTPILAPRARPRDPAPRSRRPPPRRRRSPTPAAAGLPHSEPRYERASRISVHVPMRDGVRRAVDVYRALVGRKPLDEKMPVIYLSQRYVRAWKNPDGTVDSPVARIQRDGTFTFGDGAGTGIYSWYLRFGYAVVIADMRGAGASFGPEIEFNSLEAGNDEYDVIEWIAAQPWSNGKIGMLGISYGAESQLMAAAARPPHLTALFAAAPEFDRFHGEAFVMGGVSRTGWTAQWLQGTQGSNAVTPRPPAASTPTTAPTTTPTRTIAPVDADPKGKLLAQAIEERRRANEQGQGLNHEFEVIAGIALGKLYWDEVPYASAFQADGLLTLDRSRLELTGKDRWTVDYTTTTGTTNRFMAASGSKMDYGDLAPNDTKGLTYTTAPLEADLVVVGHPVVTLYATSAAPDGDFIAYLEEVDPSGRSEYLSEGMIRASHRVLSDTTPYRYGGLPLPDGRRKIVESTPPLSAGVAELTFELYATANRFDRGNRLRVTITGIDRGNTQTPILDPAPGVTIFRSPRYPSRIELPIP